MSAPTAAWPAPTLVGSLARAGWGDLAGAQGQRSVLKALVDLLPHGSAEGKTTAAQVADAAGLSVRWTRVCLHALEAAGLIEWHRGWLDRGRPRPGIVRIVKTALVAAIRAARTDGTAQAKRAARQTGLAQRLTGLRQATQRHNPLSRRAELSSPPSFHREGTGRVPLPVDNTPRKATPMNRPLVAVPDDAAARAAAERATDNPAGKCGICSLPFNAHLARNAKVNVDARHPFEVKR